MTTKGTVTFVKEPLYMKVDTDMGFDNGSQNIIICKRAKRKRTRMA
ncbi:MAG: hypothetical protein V8Q32_00755 [Anaerotignum faecicola]